jgi:hypothetical protein
MAALVLFTLIVPPGVQGQQAQSSAPPPARPTPAIARPAPTPGALVVIYQIDLDPSGTAFAFGKPVLEGDAYVFTVWPERTVVRLQKSKVKKITQRTKNPEQEVVYRIDLAPSGRMIARENPTLKGATYTFHTWRDGKLMSLRKTDILQIVKVTGIEAFRIQQEERGAALNANLPMQGTDNVTVISEPAAQAPAAAQDPASQPGNWSYQGQPGVTDAYAPPSAVVSSPGDVPKAAPPPTPPPR